MRRLGHWIGRPASRFRRSEGGATAVEFALVGGPFFLMLLAIFETGLMMFSEYVIENGTAKAARMIRTGQVQTTNMTASQFKQVVCGNISGFLDCEGRLYVDVRNFPSFAGITKPNSINGDGELSDDLKVNAKFSPGKPLDVVVVNVYYDWKLFTPGLSHMSNLANGRRLLSASAAFRNEPYAN
jgi:Flp pilus assembly protein TadG